VTTSGGSSWVIDSRAALAWRMSEFVPTYTEGDRILCMGVGSGLNTALLEIQW